MWDLDTLAILNEQAVIRERQLRNEKLVHALHSQSYIGSVDEKAMPLTVLADRLTLGPPSIGALLDLFEQSEYLQAFVELVREYLPENEKEIMLGDHDDRAYRFCQLFGARYFELDTDMIDSGDDPMAELVCIIPVWPQGLGWEDYHEFDNMPEPMKLMLSLIENPWVDFGGDEKDARIALIEEVAGLVGKEIAEHIPKEGWNPGELHRRLDGTKYEPVAAFADAVWHDTGLALLDNDRECELPGWERETVEALTEQAPKLRKFWDDISHLDDWLTDSPQANFGEMLDFLLGREPAEVPKEQLPLPLVNPLEQQEPKTLMQIFSEEDNNDRLRPARRSDLEDLTRF